MHFEKIIIQKADLDTCLTAYICGVCRNDKVFLYTNNASDEEIYNPSILCIEAGGSGLVEYNNFDHHDTENYYPPACLQAYKKLIGYDEKIDNLIRYVCLVDEGKPIEPPVFFPSLSNVFSGMLLVEKNPLEQFFKGIELISKFIQLKLDPFQKVPEYKEWEPYIQTKIKNNEKLKQSLRDVLLFYTNKGRKAGFLKTEAIGGAEAIYSMGCDIAILYNPSFSENSTSKFTIASRNVNVSALLSVISSIESGWGGRTNIIGSPREGTSIKPEFLIEIVKKYL